MDGIVVFADENSILRTELFDEAQKVTTVGAVPVGILGEDDGTSESFLRRRRATRRGTWWATASRRRPCCRRTGATC